MSWYVCKRCDYMSKQKEVMRRHLNKLNTCKIKNQNNKLSDTELYNLSLEKTSIDDIVKSETKKNYCANCNKHFTRNYSYKQHIDNNVCGAKVTKIEKIENNVNINNPVININIGMGALRGFEEKWDVSNIDKYQMVGILFSNNKFSNTLKKILENDNNLNVIINDKSGIVYNASIDRYEPMSKNDICKQTIEKLYNHLKEFYWDISHDTNNSDYGHKSSFLDDEMKKINTGYDRYHYKTEHYRNIANEALNYFFKSVKEEAEKIYHEKNNSISF